MQQTNGQYYLMVQAILMQQSRRHCLAKQATCPEISVMQQTTGQYYSMVSHCHAEQTRCPEVSVMQPNKPMVSKVLFNSPAILMQQSRCHCHAKQTTCPEVSVMQQTFLVSVTSCVLFLVKSKNVVKI